MTIVLNIHPLEREVQMITQSMPDCLLRDLQAGLLDMLPNLFDCGAGVLSDILEHHLKMLIADLRASECTALLPLC